MDSKQFKATHKGILNIADIDIQCFVLEDGRRIISGRSLTKAIGMRGRGQGATRVYTHPALKPFISLEVVEAIQNPIPVATNGGLKPTDGYEADILLTICDAILNARDAGLLTTEHEIRYAKAADTLMRGFAKVGIVALVDEATGYQADREKDELQRILSLYVRKEYLPCLPWTLRFKGDFYEELFRLRGWQYRPISLKKPLYVGKLTNQLIYEKLPKGVLESLREKNPANENGNRKYRHHQFLTEDIGVQHLEKHIGDVTLLMKISPNWRIFMKHFARAFPEPYVQQRFDIFDEEDA